MDEDSQDVRTVLVVIGERSRPVSFKAGAGEAGRSDKLLLMEAIKEKYADVIGDHVELVLLIKDGTWGGMFVDLQGQDVEDHSVVRAMPVESHTERATSLCDKVCKPSEGHRSVLTKLFPSTASNSLPAVKPSSTFDPTAPLVTLHQKLKKKSTQIRVKPFKRWVLVLESPTSKVPSASGRRKLKREGREKRVEFRRNMSKLQVKNAIVRNFPGLKLEKATFWKSESGNLMSCIDISGGYPNGDELLTVASKESVYLVEEEVICLDGDASSDDDFEPSQPKRPRLLKEADRLLTKLKRPLSPLPSSDEESSDGGSGLQEPLQQRHELIRQQDREYEESLRVDREKAEQEAQKEERAEKLEHLRQQLRDKFRGEPSSGIHVAMRTPRGTKLNQPFCYTATTKDLYEFVYAYGEVEKSFMVYQATPRSQITCSPQLSLRECDIGRSLLVIEDDEYGVDPITWCSKELEQKEQETTESSDDWSQILNSEEAERQLFMTTSAFHKGKIHYVDRKRLFDDTIELFGNPDTLSEASLTVKFAGEMAVNTGGVSRDLLSAFWEEAYKSFFDGSSLLRPTIHPQVRTDSLPVLGAALSHGYLVSGFLPTRIAFPALVAILKGPQVQVPPIILRSCFVDYVSMVDTGLLNEALKPQLQSFPTDLKTRLVGLLSRFDCREIPTPSNILTLIDQVAHYEFLTKPMSPIAMMHQGIPTEERLFWESKSVSSLYALYMAMLTTPSKLLELISEPFFNSSHEERVYGYLEQFVGNMSIEDARKFLRFVTGSSVAVCKHISVEFNALSGLARRPIAHTCTPLLELPSTYHTYVDFADEFQRVLQDEHYAWLMDCV